MKCKLLVIPALAGSLLLLGGCGYNKNNSLVVFNYGDYLDSSIIDSFEEETGIKILYEEYQSPEEMYMKYKADIVDYDVICSSDYILEKLRQEDELLPINFDNIPNAANVDEHLWEFSKSFDPENKYTIPHYWGTLGILYNTRLVDEEVDSWDILFNQKYSGQIIMENSVRDSFVPALKLLGYSINTDNTDELDEAEAMLKEQRSRKMRRSRWCIPGRLLMRRSTMRIWLMWFRKRVRMSGWIPGRSRRTVRIRKMRRSF